MICTNYFTFNLNTLKWEGAFVFLFICLFILEEEPSDVN